LLGAARPQNPNLPGGGGLQNLGGTLGGLNRAIPQNPNLGPPQNLSGQNPAAIMQMLQSLMQGR